MQQGILYVFKQNNFCELSKWRYRTYVKVKTLSSEGLTFHCKEVGMTSCSSL